MDTITKTTVRAGAAGLVAAVRALLADPGKLKAAQRDQLAAALSQCEEALAAPTPTLQDAHRAAVALVAVEGIETGQLEAMAPGALTAAYDACSEIVETIGFDNLEQMAKGEDTDIPNDDCHSAISLAAEHAVRACAWAREAPFRAAA